MGALSSSVRKISKSVQRNQRSLRKPPVASRGRSVNLFPIKKASPLVKRAAVAGIAALAAFAPLKARALDSREPPPNIASFADTKNVRVLEKRQWGTHNEAFGFDALRVSFRPKFFGVTNSGPVFVYENIFNRTSNDSLRFGVAQQFSFSSNAVLKLGLMSPDLYAAKKELKDTRFGIIFSKGFFSADFHYRALVKGEPSYGAGAGVNVGRGVTAGIGYGTKGFSSPAESVRTGLKISELESLLGVKRGVLGRAAVDFGVTHFSKSDAEVDVGLSFPVGKNIRVGADLYDFGGAKISNKPPTKAAAFIVINF